MKNHWLRGKIFHVYVYYEANGGKGGNWGNGNGNGLSRLLYKQELNKENYEVKFNEDELNGKSMGKPTFIKVFKDGDDANEVFKQQINVDEGCKFLSYTFCLEDSGNLKAPFVCGYTVTY